MRTGQESSFNIHGEFIKFNGKALAVDVLSLGLKAAYATPGFFVLLLRKLGKGWLRTWESHPKCHLENTYMGITWKGREVRKKGKVKGKDLPTNY